jgi:hypothetical protein
MKSGLKFTIHLRWLVIWGIAIAAAIVALTWLFARSTQGQQEVIKFGASLLGATVAVLTLLYTAENIRSGNEERRLMAAARFIERWNSPGYYSSLKQDQRTLLIQLETLVPEARRERVESDAKSQTIAFEVLNFFEEMACLVRTESVNEDLLRSFFFSIAIRSHKMYEPWVYFRRNTQPTFCAEFERLVQRWLRANTEALPKLPPG